MCMLCLLVLVLLCLGNNRRVTREKVTGIFINTVIGGDALIRFILETGDNCTTQEKK